MPRAGRFVADGGRTTSRQVHRGRTTRRQVRVSIINTESMANLVMGVGV